MSGGEKSGRLECQRNFQIQEVGGGGTADAVGPLGKVVAFGIERHCQGVGGIWDHQEVLG